MQFSHFLIKQLIVTESIYCRHQWTVVSHHGHTGLINVRDYYRTNNHQLERLLQRMLGNVFHGVWASAPLLLPSLPLPSCLQATNLTSPDWRKR